MQADFAVELGPDDATLEFPWQDPDGRHRYFDLKRNPELLRDLPEANSYPELRDFLASVNCAACMLQTAKCDAWCTSEMNQEEEIFNAACKFGSYVDFLYADTVLRSFFAAHEKLARELVQLLTKAPEIPASAEFLIRRCYFHQPSSNEICDGFYITFYLFGYAENETRARAQWAIALKLVENAIRQVSAQRGR